MYKTSPMRWPRHILPVAMLGLLLALATFAASSIFSSDRASAQAREASRLDVLTSTPPDLSASIGIGEINLTWTWNTPVPPGWKHVGFTLVRGNADEDTVDKQFPEQSTSTRSFTDTLDNLSEADWLAGFKYKYIIGAVYQRLSDDAYQRDGTRIIQVEVLEAATPEEVAQYRRPPVLSSKAHADGVNLTWTRPIAAPGWRLAGYSIWRWIEGTQGTWTWVGQRLPANARSIKDPLTGSTEAQRMPGAKFKYEMYAIFERLADGERQAGKNSKTRVFTAPALPKPRNFAMRLPNDAPPEGSTKVWLTWNRPHLTWDASTGFTSVDRYHIYKDGTLWRSVSGGIIGYIQSTGEKCADGFQIQTQIGLFYSKLVDAIEMRKDCA